MPGDDANTSGGAQNVADDAQNPPKSEPSPSVTEDVKPAAIEKPSQPSPPPASSAPADAVPPAVDPVAAHPEDASAAPLSEDSMARPLNVTDALGYLDCVKQTFADRSDVYNRFLDIMKDFKSQLCAYTYFVHCENANGSLASILQVS